MKKYFAITAFLFLHFQLTLPAQLLKKLKDKAEKVVAPKKTGSDNNSNNNAEETKSTNLKEKQNVKPGENCNLVFTLEEGETLLYDESEIKSKSNKVSYAFVVVNKKYEYFLIEDGTRTGPFKEAPIKSLKRSEEEEEGNSGDADNVSVGNDKKDPVAIQYSKTIGGKLYLVFNGKNYGPYDYVSKMLVSTDKKQFFALVTIGAENSMMAKMGMGYNFMVNESGVKQKVGNSGMGMPMKFSVSKNFKHAMGTVMDSKTQKVLAVTTKGKQTEADMADMYSGAKSMSFVNDLGDIVSIPSQSPTQILVNGNEAASFKVPIKSMDRLFLMPEISKSVYYERGKVYKADGSEESIKGILFPKFISLNNEVAMYYYTIYKNENNAKEVYLCKKVF